MPSSRILIASNTLTTTAASVTFSSIPATYEDLVVRVSARSDQSTSYPNDIWLTFNSISSGYSSTWVNGYASTPDSGRESTVRVNLYYAATSASMTSNTFASTEIYIPSYTAAQNKPMSTIIASPQNSTSNVVDSATASLLSNTATISSITLSSISGANFVSGSSFYLYGISNA